MTEILDYNESKKSKARLLYAGNELKDGKWNREVFWKEKWVDTCVRCGAPMQLVYDKVHNNYFDKWKASTCTQCSWWQARWDWYSADSDDGELYDGCYIEGIARKFSIADETLPIQTLRAVLADRPDQLYDISPRKMEKLVGSVLGDFIDCEVTHTGKSHDGGVDLVLVKGEEDILVQVKHRQNMKAESVSVVREFLGAVALKRGHQGILVSSAPRFSQPAVKAAELARDIENLQISRFDLIDVKRFYEMLDVTGAQLDAPWESAMDSWSGGS